jgi:CDP-glucose 4,6-dehydratase
VEIVKSARKANFSGPIVVTGHTGFKGAWLSEILQSLSIEFAGYSLEPINDSLYSRLNHRGKFYEKYADIRDIDSISKFISTVRPEVVIHLAAQPLVLESYKDPVDTFTTNVTGTANLLKACFDCDSVKVIVVASTDKVYENLNTGKKFKESDPLMGKDPYSASKVGTEQVVSAWRQISKVSGGPTVISVRAGNVIGGGDVSPDRLLPDLVRAFSKSKEVLIRNPLSTRPWQHVLDPLVGYLMAANFALQGNDARSFNFSNQSPSLPVNEVVHIASNTWGGVVSDLISFSPAIKDESEAQTLELDSALAQSLLGWHSNWTQDEAVRSTVEWWKSVESGRKSPDEATQDDIHKISQVLQSL